MPAIVVAAAITAGAGIGSAVVGARSAGRNQRRASEAEAAALDKELAANKAANDAAMANEKDLEERRRYEWDTQENDERAQWDWYQEAMQPYRDASKGALGSLSAMLSQLTGGGGGDAGAGLKTALSQLSSMPGQADAAAASPWTPSDLVKTGAPRRASRQAPPMNTRVRPRLQLIPEGAPDVGGEMVSQAMRVADLIAKLPGRPDRTSDAYLG